MVPRARRSYIRDRDSRGEILKVEEERDDFPRASATNFRNASDRAEAMDALPARRRCGISRVVRWGFRGEVDPYEDLLSQVDVESDARRICHCGNDRASHFKGKFSCLAQQRVNAQATWTAGTPGRSLRRRLPPDGSVIRMDR
jgi:hypothetical protein